MIRWLLVPVSRPSDNLRPKSKFDPTLPEITHLHGWRLLVGIRPFTGFHRYKLVRGRFIGTFLDLSPPNGGEEFASDFAPPQHTPSGGEINFFDHGSLMGGGFYPMFNDPAPMPWEWRAVCNLTIRRRSADADDLLGRVRLLRGAAGAGIRIDRSCLKTLHR